MDKEHFFGNTVGIAGGIYGLYYAHTRNCNALGYIGYWLAFTIGFTYVGYIADAIIQTKPEKK